MTKAYWRFLSSGRFLSASGPMWFAVALLIFCVFYAAWRLIGRETLVGKETLTPIPGHGQVTGLIALMGSCTFLVRVWQPIGTSVLNMQLCYFSQYILLFCIGILAYRGNWLMRIPRGFGLFWMKLALVAGIPGWGAFILTSGLLGGDRKSLLGGWHWQSAAFSFWEALFCLGVCLGLIVLFRDRFNRQGRFSRWMSRNSFSAYLFHTPMLVAVTLALKDFSAPRGLKFFLASLLAVPITFLVSGFLRPRIPGLRKVL